MKRRSPADRATGGALLMKKILLQQLLLSMVNSLHNVFVFFMLYQ